jgi:hypothetical protein
MFNKILFVISVLFLILVAGCGAKSTSSVLNNNNFDAYQKTLSKTISEDIDTSIINLEIVFSKLTNDQKGMLSYFIFEADDMKYQGSVFSDLNETNSWEVYSFFYKAIDQNVPFTKIQIAGTSKHGNYHMISGFIHDKNIEKIVISFTNGLLVEVRKGDTNFYSYALFGDDSDSQVAKVEGLSSEGEVIHYY